MAVMLLPKNVFLQLNPYDTLSGCRFIGVGCLIRFVRIRSETYLKHQFIQMYAYFRLLTSVAHNEMFKNHTKPILRKSQHEHCIYILNIFTVGLIG